MAWWRKLIRVVLLAGSTVVLTLSEHDLRSKGFWHQRLGVGLFVAALCVLVVKQAKDLFLPPPYYRREPFVSAVREATEAALVRIEEVAKLDWKDVRVNAHVVRGTLLLQQERPWVRLKELERIATTFRVRSLPHRAIHWTRGKGVIGKCWQQGVEIFFSREESWAPYEECDASSWEQVGSAIRMGLSYDEMRALGNYAAVLATPILTHAQEVIGVVSADAPWAAEHSNLLTDEVAHALRDTATTIANLMAQAKEN